MKVLNICTCLILMVSGFSLAEENDLEKTLAYARNEIFARHGRTFTDPVYQKYFEQFDWYRINNNYSDDLLTEEDRRDIKIILRWERELPNLSDRERTYLREITQTMSKYRYLSEGFSIEKKEDITGDGKKDLLKTNVHVIDGKVLCDSEILTNNQIIWKERLVDPYLGLGKSPLFYPDQSDIWVRFYIASKYAAPKITSIAEYEHISIDFG
ncbi:MAG: YARHG domain-containing protein [Acidobacteria bacterium]|nr:YARHG domain-containing protein [Acidobacteriota bacterium]